MRLFGKKPQEISSYFEAFHTLFLKEKVRDNFCAFLNVCNEGDFFFLDDDEGECFFPQYLCLYSFHLVSSLMFLSESRESLQENELPLKSIFRFLEAVSPFHVPNSYLKFLAGGRL